MNAIIHMIPPVPVVMLAILATGTGKSHEARDQVSRLLRQLPGGACLVISTPTHDLNNEHLERLVSLLQDDGVNVAVYRGRNAKDPARPGKNMCDLADEAAELSAAGGDANDLCSKRKVYCDFYEECGYQKQYNLTAQVWIAPHAVITRKRPSCIPVIFGMIIDEDIWQTFLSGFGRPVRVSMDELRVVRRVPEKVGGKKIDDAKTADLEAASVIVRRVMSSIEGISEPISIHALTEEGMTEQIAHDARLAMFNTKKLIRISPDMPPDQRSKKIKEAAIHNKPIIRMARMYKLIEAAISRDQDVLPGCRFERGVDTGDGSQFDAIRLRWLEALPPSWTTVTMILSATAQPVLLQSIWPQLEQVAESKPEAPHATVRQILWPASAGKLKEISNLGRLKRYIEARAFEFRGSGAVVGGRRVDVLVGSQQKAEVALNALGVPENVDTAHFNAVDGIDKWKDIGCLISIGRTMASPNDVELMAEVLSGKLVKRKVDFPGGWYPRVFAGIRVKGSDEVGHPTLTEEHPDPLAEAVRWSVCEAAMMQLNGRCRAIRRTASNPVQIDIISMIPLPMTVDEVLTWEQAQPSPYQVMMARGLVIDEKATKGKWQIVQKVLPDLFDSVQAARHALNRSNANNRYILVNERLSDFTHATVKIAGARYAVPVFIDGSRTDPRALAEKLLGPLEEFEVIGPLEELPQATPFDAPKSMPPVNPEPPPLVVGYLVAFILPSLSKCSSPEELLVRLVGSKEIEKVKARPIGGVR